MFHIVLPCRRVHYIFVSFHHLADGYTTEDLIFIWQNVGALSMRENLELPEFAITGMGVGDCTRVFTTGIRISLIRISSKL